MQRWQRPLVGPSEERPSQPDYEGRPGILWHLDDESVDRIRQCLACHNCLITFPAPPRRENVHLFRDVPWGVEWPEAKRRIKNEQCPTCRAHVSADLANASYAEAEKEWLIRPIEIDREQEQWVKSESRIWVPGDH